MVRSLLLTFVLLLSAGMAFSQTILTGKVTDDKGEGLIGATVKVLKGTDFVRGAITDFNGDYRIALDAGSYDVEFSYTGYQTSKVTAVRVLVNQLNYLNNIMSNMVLGEVEIKAFKVPLIEQDKTQGGQTLTSDQIKNLPTRSVNAIVATTAGTTSVDGGEINIKGSRSNATNYYIDGIRVAGSPPPVQDIEQLQVITGGLGAEYGDVTGGVISVVTKGPANEYHGAIEVENSHGLDPYGWLLATANVSGPLLKRKRADGSKETMLGFRLSGQYNYQKDDDPPAIPVYRAKQSVLDRLNEHPLTRFKGNVVSAAEFLTNDSVDVYDYNPFEKSTNLDLTGKLDFRVTDNIDLSITGTFKDVQDQATPGGWLLLNAQNNPTNYSDRRRVIARFRHRLGNSDGSDASSNRVSISNASYQLQFGFERGTGTSYDPRHKENIFNYGYIGRYDFTYVPFLIFRDNGQIAHADYLELFSGFKPGYADSENPTTNPNQFVPNPGLVGYNEFATEGLYSSYLAQNGRFSGVYDDIWSGMHSNINVVNNGYSKSQDDIMTIMASSSFDLKLGKTGTHNIQFGLINEQRTSRAWSIAPFGLWDLAYQKANNHFNGIDTLQVLYYDTINNIPVPIHPITYEDQPENTFYRKIREVTGQALNEYVNVHGLRPDQLRLDMFSALELNNQALLGYYGYDYLGNKLPDDVTFNDYFTSKVDGIRNFPVAAIRPLYQAAYVKDKFTFNKMIFSLGLRVERFDLNTKIMRDEFSLYEVMNASEFHTTQQGVGAKPAGVGDDYKVYVNSLTDNAVKAYRNGNLWYKADGTQVNDGNVIFQGEPVTPFIRDQIRGGDILSEQYDPNTSFSDYVPQVNWLPRLAFSFPISDDANFFAHYDILVQRPPSNWEVTPLDYTYFYIANRTPGNNPALKPERVVDYEVGFQQKLNQNSALKFSAYYREMRDMIQSRTILYVPIIGSYESYGNIDFGTVKGFTVQYDLRRIQNAELRLAYTLQFADGTGSNANSQRGLTTRGNLRALFPLSYDERHNLNAIFDYRFDSGKRYNGPRIAGLDVLANFGANLIVNATSGRPYTARTVPQRFGGTGVIGSFNSNRLPWRFTLDLRLDKSFSLTAADKKPLNLNVYFRVSNLLNRKNVIGVYSASGSPTDDGYLATNEGQTTIQAVANQGRDIAPYLASYTWAMLNPDRFTLPRRMYIGAALEF